MIMLKDRIAALFDALGAGVSEIAAFTDMDVTNISRLKSGARAPKHYSSTMDKLADGILCYCEEKDKWAILRSVIQAESGDLKQELKEWLVPHEEPADTASFPARLDAVMVLTDTSNKELGKRINLDASYISRIRNGSRRLRSNSPIYDAISHALFAAALDKGLLEEIKTLAELSSDEDDVGVYYSFKNWLCSFKSEDKEIRSLLRTLNVFDPVPVPPFDRSTLDLSYSEKDRYMDDRGLQDASLRFLTEVIESEAKEIYLYSDRNIEWMMGDKEYRLKWVYLMTSLVTKGIKVKIIHNIDRKLPDMVNAVSNWMPLYMSCCIEPYYTNVKGGKRFTHTLFVCPGVACISAFDPYGEEHSLFHYYTAEEEIAHGEYQFEALLRNSLPLMHMQKGRTKPSSDTYMQTSGFSNIEIAMDAVSVTVMRTSEPKVSFVILNDMLCDAIRAYCTNTNRQMKTVSQTPR